MNSRATQLKFTSMRMMHYIMAASQLHVLANENAELARRREQTAQICINIKHHIALPSEPTVYSLYCGIRLHSL